MKHFAQHHFFLLSLCYRTEYLLVGTVNEGVIEPFQIDACCAFGGVSHRFADGCYRYILALGNTCPRVTRYIRCEFGGQAQLLAQFLQVMVDEVYPVLILTLLVNAGKSDEGKEIRGVVFMIFIHQFLHTGFPMDSYLLSRLLTAIDKIVALQVGLLQIGDVYQRHATGVETKEEDVAR